MTYLSAMHPRLLKALGIKAVGLLVLTLMLSGCTQSFYLGKKPQSNFAYPNSNVAPLQRVSGKASKTKIFYPPTVDAIIEREAIEDALRGASGADLLINYQVYAKLTLVPLLYINIYTLTVTVEGTAATADLGYQLLN